MGKGRTGRSASCGGFTLAELAVALVILALLLAGALIPISTQVELRNIAETQRSLEAIKESITGFALANGRLPCPASGAVASATAGAGAEQWDSINNRCSTVIGVVPWSTLAVAEFDAWGRRFTYRVSPVFSDAVDPTPATTVSTSTLTTPASPGSQSLCDPTPKPANASFALCSLGDMAVVTRNEATHGASVMGAGLPAVIVSHGKNGWGGFNANGVRHGVGQPGDVNSDGVPDQNADEAANLAGTPSAATGVDYAQYRFYSRVLSPVASGCSDTAAGSAFCEFDDIVAWIAPSTLIARTLAAGRLP